MQTKGNDNPKVPQSLKLFLVKSVALIKSTHFSDSKNLIQQFLTSNWSHNSYFLRLPVSNLTESPKRPCVRFACSVSPAYKYPDVWVRHCGTEDYSISVKKLPTPLYSHNEDHNFPANEHCRPRGGSSSLSPSHYVTSSKLIGSSFLSLILPLVSTHPVQFIIEISIFHLHSKFSCLIAKKLYVVNDDYVPRIPFWYS